MDRSAYGLDSFVVEYLGCSADGAGFNIWLWSNLLIDFQGVSVARFGRPLCHFISVSSGQVKELIME